jgi:hypothetical protein
MLLPFLIRSNGFLAFSEPLLSLAEGIEKFFEDDIESKFGKDFSNMAKKVEQSVKEYMVLLHPLTLLC